MWRTFWSHEMMTSTLATCATSTSSGFTSGPFLTIEYVYGLLGSKSFPPGELMPNCACAGATNGPAANGLTGGRIGAAAAVAAALAEATPGTAKGLVTWVMSLLPALRGAPPPMNGLALDWTAGPDPGTEPGPEPGAEAGARGAESGADGTGATAAATAGSSGAAASAASALSR